MTKLVLPATYWLDYASRCPVDNPSQMAQEVSSNARTVTVECTPEQLAYLEGDARFYAEGNTDDTPRAVVQGAKRTLQIISQTKAP